MNKKEYKIHIVGAGMSGLTAALVLEKHGYHPILLESSDNVGGRVKTNRVNGYQLDHGFQVLLTAYPKAKQYLNYEKLELQPFLPGAILYKNGKQQTIGDPLRSISFLLPTLFSSLGKFSDKIKIFKLNTRLKKETIPSIFHKKEVTTLEYLKNIGFSNAMINQFFKPFFSGIFLENELKTSSRMFEFVYKMFGEGMAVIPKKGIGAIPEQLKNNLESTEIQYNTAVDTINEGTILLKNGTEIKSDFTIIATDPSQFLSGLSGQEVQWQQCFNLYFETHKKAITKPIIGLIADDNAIINNMHYCTNLKTEKQGSHELLSVTVVKKHNLNTSELIERVEKDLATYCNIKNLTFLKCYPIPKALPILKNIQNSMECSETKLSNTLFLAGDHLLNGSLNAAMESGEKAALAIIENIESNGFR